MGNKVIIDASGKGGKPVVQELTPEEEALFAQAQAEDQARMAAEVAERQAVYQAIAEATSLEEVKAAVLGWMTSRL